MLWTIKSNAAVDLVVCLCIHRTNVYHTDITHLEIAPISHAKWYYVNINFRVFFFEKLKKTSN